MPWIIRRLITPPRWPQVIRQTCFFLGQFALDVTYICFAFLLIHDNRTEGVIILLSWRFIMFLYHDDYAVQCQNTFTPRQFSGWRRSAGFFSVLLISESSFLFDISFESFHIWYLLFGSSIPHICHRHHRRCLCINFLSGVHFSRLSEKNANTWLFQRHF